MSHMNRLWVAAGVAVVNGHSDHGKKRFGDAADLRPISGVLNSEVGGPFGGGGGGEEKRRQSEDSLRQVMYLSCWGQS
ncbi:hypothetical protein PHJA_001098100 [Phtheirospermum japonicum]|uniref:Uncharacterized protein n=1 Tax=Phtheirospermum japonicum TaxID=374723 RepID=A0A830C2D1_9LAMI|nr:hypothetical protein PHJA_001098100 [Phtheirospermum japonicum]